MEKNKRITNIYYRKFLDEGVIQTLSETDIQKVLDAIDGTYMKEARALVIALYYTGARPAEILALQSDNITRDGRHCIIQLQTKKNGMPRKASLMYSKPFVKELYAYASSLFSGMFLFYHFKGHYKHTYVSTKGDLKVYDEESYKLRYYFKKWFKDVLAITPYYLRHNRFSKLAERGVPLEQIRQLKGSKSIDSVYPYVHMSTDASKKLARYND